SPLATLDAYLAACHPLMSLILLIPPIDPSTALRAELLLRYTGEVLDAIPCYPATRAVLPRLSSWLDELDKGWSAVLDAKIWDTETSRGRDVSRALPNMVFSPTIEDVPPGTHLLQHAGLDHRVHASAQSARLGVRSYRGMARHYRPKHKFP
ncbi:hypothetical protein BKA62DRAFT_629010, partial [Auriculariales sp. MPI-PUGE-AT-0066]